MTIMVKLIYWFLIGAIFILANGGIVTHVFAHEPIFGLGPHTIFKGGIGIEMEVAGDKASGGGKSEKDLLLNTEVIYGVTPDLSVTLAFPTIFDRKINSNSNWGAGDFSLRGKYRFWRHDTFGTQDSAAVITGVKFPTGKASKIPRLGTGSFDFLFGLTAARESRRWYIFGDVQYRLNREGSSNLKAGDKFFANTSIGIRPWLGEYLDPDPVVVVEFNWERQMKSQLSGTNVADSGGNRLFVSPGLILTYRNWAVKGGVQILIYHDLNRSQLKDKYRFAVAIESHL